MFGHPPWHGVSLALSLISMLIHKSLAYCQVLRVLEQDQMNELGLTVQVLTLALERLTQEDHHKHEARLSSIVNSSLLGLHNNTLLKKERQLIQQWSGRPVVRFIAQ